MNALADARRPVNGGFRRRNACISWAFALAMLPSFAFVSPAFADQKSAVNAQLRHHHDQFRTPRLVQVRPGIHVAHAYGLANFAFIEGKHGIIVIDTGWFADEMRHALRDLRKVTSKPITAIIYTHAHPDHTGGGGLLVEDGRPIPIYAPAGFGEPEWDQAGRQFGIALERGVSQLGLFLKAAGQYPDGGGVGPAPVMGERQFRAPTHFVDARQRLQIDGRYFTLIPAGMDVASGLMIWLEDQRILFCGDTVTGVFTILETPRYAPTRDPEKMARSFDLALGLEPDVVIPGHGRLLLDRKDARDVLTGNRNLSHFLIDQVDRLINAGLGVEEIVHQIQLPDRLFRHPDLQPFYHRKDWIIRGLVMKRVGWNSEMLDLVREDGVTEARNLLDLVGKTALEEGFQAAMQKGEYRWAARLARWLMLAQNEPQGRELYWSALSKIAATTTSANERSYILTDLAVWKRQLDLRKMLTQQKLAYASSRASIELIDHIRARVKPGEMAGNGTAFNIEVDDTAQPFQLILVDDALIFASPSGHNDFSIRMPRDVLNLLHAGQVAWSELDKRDDVRISGDKTKFAQFAASLD